MARVKAAVRHLCPRDTEAFATSEEAWFWYVQCQIARDDGVRFIAGQGVVARPCEPDDIVREASRLHRAGALRSAHLAVLRHFGRRLTPPNPHGDDTSADARLWEEALDRLTTPLRRKGIVA